VGGHSFGFFISEFVGLNKRHNIFSWGQQNMSKKICYYITISKYFSQNSLGAGGVLLWVWPVPSGISKKQLRLLARPAEKNHHPE
jgi:hypothetical protein